MQVNIAARRKPSGSPNTAVLHNIQLKSDDLARKLRDTSLETDKIVIKLFLTNCQHFETRLINTSVPHVHLINFQGSPHGPHLHKCILKCILKPCKWLDGSWGSRWSLRASCLYWQTTSMNSVRWMTQDTFLLVMVEIARRWNVWRHVSKNNFWNIP